MQHTYMGYSVYVSLYHISYQGCNHYTLDSETGYYIDRLRDGEID